MVGLLTEVFLHLHDSVLQLLLIFFILFILLHQFLLRFFILLIFLLHLSKFLLLSLQMVAPLLQVLEDGFVGVVNVTFGAYNTT